MGEYLYDSEMGVQVLNETDMDTSEVFQAFAQANPEMAAMVRWTNATKMPQSRHGSLFDRDRYITPESTWDQMRVAYHAAETDDVVAGILEMTEALAFGRVSIDTEDPDETNIWNQISENIDLDVRLREMWRENFTVSQFYTGMWWGRREYKVTGKSEAGVARKKSFGTLKVPLGLTILDPLKIVPIGNLMFNKDTLAYCADNTSEYDVIKAVIDGRQSDDLIRQLMVGPYIPDDDERRMLSDDGINTGRLFRLNPQNVWRHTDTRPQYQRFATVRLKSVFELLDLKAQLRALDRALLLGGTNFIVLIKKGDTAHPAKPMEVQALQQQVRTLSRTPVIVGDHRLNIEIITPKTDNTLEPAKYNGIDSRITSRLYMLFSSGNFQSGAKGDDSIKLAKMVARGLESRRHTLKLAVEKYVLRPTFEANRDKFTQMPKLRFHPKRIALDFDPTYANFLLDLYDRGPLATESILEEIDYDIDTELRRRKAEKPYDDVFTPRSAPGANLGQAPEDPKSAGRTAGRRLGGVKNGGGAAPGSGQGQAPEDERNLSDDK